MRLLKRLKLLFWKRRQFEAELAEELRIHREMDEAAFVAAGESSTDARNLSRRRFGGEALTLEDSRRVWSLQWLEEFSQDVRYAARGWLRNPGFATVVITTIGIALGLNTALFTAFDHYLLRPVAVRDPASLYQVEWSVKSGAGHFFTWEEFQSLRKQSDTISGAYAAFGILGQIDQQPAFGQMVTADFFDVLGARIAIGRPFTPVDAPAPGTGAFIVLGNNCWRSKFGSDPAILGRQVHVRGQPFEVIGVAAPDFTGIGPVPADFWVPLTMYAELNNGTNITAASKTGLLLAVVRLRQDLSIDAAKSALLAWSVNLTKDYAADHRAVAISLESRANAIPMNKAVIIAFAPIFIAFALVLLTACANVSNMMLARALMRQREIGIRLSLGAGRPRLIRQLLTEALMLSLPASLLGLVLSILTVNGIRELFYRTIPSRFGKLLQVPDMQPDYRVFAFVLLAAVATTLLFGLVPTIQATRGGVTYATRGDFGNDFRPSRLRNVMIIAQIFVCVLMLAASLIILDSETRVANRDVRVDPRQVLDVRVQSKFAARLAARFGQEPVVERVAAVSRAPLYGGLPALSISGGAGGQSVKSYFNLVSPGYFDLLRIPVQSGKVFTETEAQSHAAVVIVSEATARRLWPGESPLGRELRIEADRENRFFAPPAFSVATVVGVAGDVVNGYASEVVDSACVYFPIDAANPAATSLLVRVHGDIEAAKIILERTVQQAAPGAADRINSLEEVLATQLYPFQVLSWFGGCLAAIALVFVISGVYGVLSFVVTQRSKEIGIRMALGASTGNVVSMILGQSLRMALGGAALGAGAMLALAPLFAQEIDTLRPFQPIPYALAISLVLLAAALASSIPALRATRLDAATTLRAD